MQNLERIIQPDIGILTNIGPAHDEGFVSIVQKIDEKLKLFGRTNILIYRAENKMIRQEVESKFKGRLFSWSTVPIEGVDVIFREQQGSNNEKIYLFNYNNLDYVIITPGTSWVYQHKESGENVANCHKIPSSEFNRILLNPREIIKSMERSR